jgi:ATP-dependent helicase YprA (DUF1998 family)/very-short-patch-repair endonuclease
VNVFELREQLVADYADYTRSFLQVRDPRIAERVEAELNAGLLWPEPLVQLNPSYESGGLIDELIEQGLIHPECSRVFRRGKTLEEPGGQAMRLHRHQVEAIEAARRGANYVLTTGTGSGKSLAYMVPIVDSVLREPGPGIKAIVVYPMNALANSQENELRKFLQFGFPNQRGPVTFARYTGQEKEETREAIMANPPDILLTNYVMLELLLTRPRERRLVAAANALRFLVLDELHTYRGRQGADVALLVRRVRQMTGSRRIQYVGTSATLASGGTLQEQRRHIAEVATSLFGATVEPDAVIGETLRRATADSPEGDAGWQERLRERVAGTRSDPADAAAFRDDELASWVESELGVVRDPDEAHLVRRVPRPLTGEAGAAASLANQTGLPQQQCETAIRAMLELGQRLQDPETGFPLFAFRIHQFFSRGDAVYASIGDPATRFITTQAQELDPTDPDRQRILLPLAFCRECGQDYYVIERASEDQNARLESREVNDVSKEEDRLKGFLFVDAEGSWPTDPADVLERLPEDWIDQTAAGATRVKSSFRRLVPTRTRVGTDGTLNSADGIDAFVVPAPMRFCLNCDVTYSGQQTSDLGKVTTLGSGGRSSATSLLSLTAIRQLRKDESLPQHARKLLAFTDNRQDASLQAGHFNDFVLVGLVRAALHKAALEAASSGGLHHDTLTQRVTEALALPIEHYAQDPTVMFVARQETDRALRDLIGYRLYRDLERGWRVTAPNLEQTGLLEIRYEALEELAATEAVWANLDPRLARSTVETRAAAMKVLLDFMRRHLAIQVDYLNPVWQEQLKLRSNQHLIVPWAVDEEERLERATVVYPRSVRPNDPPGRRHISGRSGMGSYVQRHVAPRGERMKIEEREAVIRDLLEALRKAGLVGLVEPPTNGEAAGGYQIKAAGMRWVGHPATDAHPYTDPIRVPRPPKDGHRPNPFFLRFYTETAARNEGIQAKEHTAQVPADERIKREEEFREARLPILYCSPTMELGVDIAELNVVGLRNIPPTPANYAQRSGRAGRSGNPALLFNYCAWGSSHDQYFFRRPQLMVAGQVRPPRLDLANEDLVRAHVHALWLAETNLDLKSSLADILDLSGDPPALELHESVRAAAQSELAQHRALDKARELMTQLPGIADADWYSEQWLDMVIRSAPGKFDAACDRWRELYLSAWQNRAAQHEVIGNRSRPEQERTKARQLRDQAEAQLNLLTGETEESRIQSDFYSYRYFASEGFLPGYAFPRLPLSAWIPGRRGAAGRNDYLSRPRFLAISEFGPRSIVYHEGSRYRITQVMLPAERLDGNRLVTEMAKRCEVCGYLHRFQQTDPGPDLCEHCGSTLPSAIDRLFRLRNVQTRRQDRITSDEEERQRQGFEIWTSVRFAAHEGGASTRKATLSTQEDSLAELTYAPAATIWRINVGWRRRGNKARLGFVLDTERGYWGRNDADPEDSEDARSKSEETVIPYVEDTRNVLLFDPVASLDDKQMASLGAAIKVAIQAEFQLEDSELAVEPLPSEADRRQLLLYEAAEGGAGVLRRLATEPDAWPRVAARALEISHFDPATGDDLHRAPGARDDCAAACYDCLMSYGNQRDHPLLDRYRIRDWLLALAISGLQASSSYRAPDEHLQMLLRAAESSLERSWVEALDERGYRLPTRAQHYVEAANARPDFLYDDSYVAIFLDGPVHDYEDVKVRDESAQQRLEDAGYYVLRFSADPRSWVPIFESNPNVFGKR